MGVRYRNGFTEFDKVLEEIADEIREKQINKDHVLGSLSHIVAIPFLLRVGMRQKWMLDFIQDRLTVIHEFVVKEQYDIYENIKRYKGIPQSFKNRPVIREDLYVDGKIKFPLEYDIYGFAAIYSEADKKTKEKIDDVIAYILDSKFQAIEDGYGLLHKKGNYWAMGWDPKPTDLCRYYMHNPLLLKMDLLSNFPRAINTEWFISAVELIDNFANEDGVYFFLKNILQRIIRVGY